VPKGSIARAILPLFEAEYPENRFTLNAVGQALRRLEQRGVIQRTYHAGNIVFELTEQGRQKQSIHTIDTIVMPLKPAVWDGKWRIVLFSIPESRKAVRVQFRKTLESFGFALLHRSAWVYPYPCEPTIQAVAIALKIQSEITIVIAESIDPDAPFRKLFQLSAVESPAAPFSDDSTSDELIPLAEFK